MYIINDHTDWSEELTPLPIAYDLSDKGCFQGAHATVGDWKNVGHWLKGNFLKSHYVTMFLGSFD